MDINWVHPNFAWMMSKTGLGWGTRGFKFAALDLDLAGPSPGAWRLQKDHDIATLAGPPYRITFSTEAPHGFVPGQKVYVVKRGHFSHVPQWQPNEFYFVGQSLRSNDVDIDHLVHKCVSQGQALGTEMTESIWGQAVGDYFANGSSFWQVWGDSRSPINDLYVVEQVPTEDSWTAIIPERRGWGYGDEVGGGDLDPSKTDFGWCIPWGAFFTSVYGPPEAWQWSNRNFSYAFGRLTTKGSYIRVPPAATGVTPATIVMPAGTKAQALFLIETQDTYSESGPDKDPSVQYPVAVWTDLPGLPFVGGQTWQSNWPQLNPAVIY